VAILEEVQVTQLLIEEEAVEDLVEMMTLVVVVDQEWLS
jgi:hypothetical protein